HAESNPPSPSPPSAPSSPAAVSPDKLRDLTSPWSAAYEEPEESNYGVRSPDAEHTVFDPEALKKLRERARARTQNGGGVVDGEESSLDETLAVLGEEMVHDEPTRFDERARKNTLPSPFGTGREVSDVVEPREEPTTFDTKNPLNDPLKKKMKLGGSAA